MSSKKRLLFVAESVTLAQIVRLVSLARALDRDAYEVHFACASFPELVFGGTSFIRHSIESLEPQRAARALAAGRRLYEQQTLTRYIAEERELIQHVRPELVIGDFRLSLSTSAELSGVRSAVLINAYWSPYAPRDTFPVPDHPVVRWLGERLTAHYFQKVVPKAFDHFAAPLNQARSRLGLPPLGSLLQVLTHGDYTLYPDDPLLTPIPAAPSQHRFLGPVLWQPESSAIPESAMPGADSIAAICDRSAPAPLVYVTLGSSGDVRLLPKVVEVLGHLPVRAVVSTAGRVRLGSVPPNVLVAEFVRGAEVARQACVVISNGGSTTGYQALSQGTPVLGLPSNLDQYLATQAIDRAQAGRSLGARRAGAAELRQTLLEVMASPELKLGAQRIAASFSRHDSGSAFRAFVAEVTQLEGFASQARVSSGQEAQHLAARE